MVIKTTTYCPNSFSCGFFKTLRCGVLIADHFFSHTQCPGAVHGFWSFYYGGKGPYLGVFPILQYKRPQGKEGFFLGISNLGWFEFSEVLCTRGHENWKKIKHLFFVKFCVSGVMKIGKKSSIWLSFMCTRWLSFTCTRGNENWWKIKYLILVKCWSWSFVYPGSWKLEKIEIFDFSEVLCTQGRENWKKLSICFLWSFVYPGSWKLEKIKHLT